MILSFFVVFCSFHMYVYHICMYHNTAILRSFLKGLGDFSAASELEVHVEPPSPHISDCANSWHTPRVLPTQSCVSHKG